MANRWGNSGNSDRLYYGGGAPKSLQMSSATIKLKKRKKKTFASWQESYDHPGQHIKKQRHYFANKGPSNQGCSFPCSHVWMSELDYKEN